MNNDNKPMVEDDKPKILIIEDEALVARELKSRLTQMGCEVVGIAYGREAIALARETRPDLLLADIHLKDGANGIDVAETIQQERYLPVVFLTAYSDSETVSRAKSVTPYSYIIKPVENRELQIAIEMALYKYNIERELHETRQLLETALACIGNALVFVDDAGNVTELNEDARRMLGRTSEEAQGHSWRELFELGSGSSVGETIDEALQRNFVTKLAPFLLPRGDPQVPYLIDGIVGPIDSGGVLILRQLAEIHDPIEMLPATEDVLSGLGPDQLAPVESSICQLLIYTDAATDDTGRILENVSDLLDKVLRSTDLVSIYAGSLLSVSMPYTSVEEGKKIADATLQELRQHSFGREEVIFSIGLAHSSPGDQQPIELFRRAGWALNIAIESGGDRVAVWTPESERKIEDNTRALAARQYHNLVLLWNVMSVVAKATDLTGMVQKFCNHLLHSFDMNKVAVIGTEQDTVRLVGGVASGGELLSSAGDLELDRDALAKISGLLSGHGSETVGKDTYVFVIRGDTVLFMCGELNDSDREFVRTLTRYFATSLAGFDLVEEPKDPPEETGRELIAGSSSMEGVLESAQLVAPTDATVLISGESGTGKEMIARRIHSLSSRSDNPFIIVDCGAVVGSLIESELFGHVKGAFTGADKDFSGRLKEADGGTVLLDEIGELPLDVQVKLLRFVQERQLVPVGTNTVYTVDTRVIAATNKNLKELVEQGKFREDLYYRLNVFSVETPPLRERKGDILALASHYLERFGRQYDKNIEGFSQEAERALVDHDWPGNVRELVNIINRAVILCKDSTLNTIHLGLFPDADNGVADEQPAPPPRSELNIRLCSLVDKCLEARRDELPPLGQWLEEDLINGVMTRYGDAFARTAKFLNMSEATVRRKVARMRQQYGDGPPERPPKWVSVDSMLDQLREMARRRDTSITELISGALLDEINRRDLSKTEAATLMGVSLPTYRRMSS